MSRVGRFPWIEHDASCETHGAFVAREFAGGRRTSCPDCAEEQRLADERESAAADRLLEQQERLDAIGLRGWLAGATFATFPADSEKAQAVLTLTRNFAANVQRDGGGGLWLIGPPGVGKSGLGAAIAQAVVVQRGFTARMLTPREIVRELRATWHQHSGETEEGVIDRLGSVDLLVLDEADSGFGTDSEAMQLLEVIDRRSQLRRPTVVLSNLNAAGLKAGLGERIYDRLRHGAVLRVCDWSSHRRPAE